MIFLSDIVIITTMDSCSSIIAGCITFGILGNLAAKTGTHDIASVVKGGAGLAFISYPDAIAKFELLPQVSIQARVCYVPLQRSWKCLLKTQLPKGICGSFLFNAIRSRYRQHRWHGFVHCSCHTRSISPFTQLAFGIELVAIRLWHQLDLHDTGWPVCSEFGGFLWCLVHGIDIGHWWAVGYWLGLW